MNRREDSHGESQAAEWTDLFLKIRAVLERFGQEDPFGRGDYLIVDDNYGHRWHTVEIHKLRMLRPEAIKALQFTLSNMPDWEIVVAVDIPGTEGAWPLMGLTVRQDEIIDGLQREYFPDEFRSYSYVKSRPETDRD